MPMFDDPKQELEKLQEQLLEQEDWFERELDAAKRLIGDAPVSKAAPGKSTAQPKIREIKLNEETIQTSTKKKAKKKKKKSNRGLIILALVEALGILGLALYWVLVLL